MSLPPIVRSKKSILENSPPSPKLPVRTVLPNINVNRFSEDSDLSDRRFRVRNTLESILEEKPSEDEVAPESEIDVTAVINKTSAEMHPVQKKAYRIRNYRTNLVTINAQRVMNILHEGVTNIDMGFLIPILCRNIVKAPTTLLGKPTNEMLRFQGLLKNFFDDRQMLGGKQIFEGEVVSTDSQKSVVTFRLHDRETQIKLKIRTLFKLIQGIQHEEESWEFLESLRDKKTEVAQALEEDLDNLRTTMFERMSMGQPEVLDMARKIADALSRRRLQRITIEELGMEFGKHETLTKKLCDDLDAQIKKVMDNLADVQKKSILQTKKRHSIMNATHDVKDNWEKRMDKLEFLKKEMQLAVDTVKEEHVKHEIKLREKKYKMETEKENWIAKYDKDVGNLQDKFDLIWVVYAAQRKILDDLEARFAVLEITYNELVAQREAEEAERTRAKRELLSMNKAAMIIQAFWRTRAVLKRLQSKKNKGKK